MGKRRAMTAKEMRSAAASLARRDASISDGMGDPEGAAQFRDLAREIDRLRLTVDVETNPARRS